MGWEGNLTREWGMYAKYSPSTGSVQSPALGLQQRKKRHGGSLLFERLFPVLTRMYIGKQGRSLIFIKIEMTLKPTAAFSSLLKKFQEGKKRKGS